jgi:hypothetical protein
MEMNAHVDHWSDAARTKVIYVPIGIDETGRSDPYISGKRYT